jgi:hypothetical protein
MDDHEILKSKLSRRRVPAFWLRFAVDLGASPHRPEFKPFTAGELAGLTAKTLPKAGEGKYRTSVRLAGGCCSR